MLPDPDLLVLDEPTTGVDPVSRSEVWRLIASAASAGAAVVLASTYLDEAERASDVLILHHGAVLASGSPEQVVDSMAGAIVDLPTPRDRARAWPRGGRWREWRPAGDPDAVTPDLEDAVIAASLAAEEAAS
jgi:ABC-2 type transport system ATP-binding protein